MAILVDFSKGELGVRTWGSLRMLLVLGKGMNLERGNAKEDNAVAV